MKIFGKIFFVVVAIFSLALAGCSKDDDKNNDNDFSGESGTFTDSRDGVIYKWVRIGTQIWMAENLRTIQYNDGTSIPNVTDQTIWEGLTTGGWCNYNNDVSYGNTYGKLYNWHAVNTGKLAPKGWHVPTDAEWTVLSNYLGGESVAGGQMKSVTIWSRPNTGATNSSGFSALPGGNRGDHGFITEELACDLWSSTPEGTDYAWFMFLDFVSSYLYTGYRGRNYGFSVRCVKDY